MNITQAIGLSCASFAFVLPAISGVGAGVRYIEHAEPDLTSLQAMSDDGSTLIFATYGAVPSILVDRGVGLQSIYESENSSSFVWSGGLSDDGSVVSINALNSSTAMSWSPGVLTGIPDLHEEGFGTFSGAVSGNGLVQGLYSHDTVMLYRDRVLYDLGFSDPDRSYSLQVSGLDQTGQVLVMNQNYTTSFGEDPVESGYHAWMWDQNGFMEIPDLPLVGDRVDSFARGVSSDGTTVFGSSNSLFYDDLGVPTGFGYDQAWIYRDGVQTAINDGTFGFVNASDISDDGSLVLVSAGNEEHAESYLWSEAGGFVSIVDLLSEHGLSLGAGSVGFYQMSGDATVFAGQMYTEGYGFTTVVVTIPGPGAIFLMACWLPVASGRSR